jgi:hypothetical protein
MHNALMTQKKHKQHCFHSQAQLLCFHGP